MVDQTLLLTIPGLVLMAALSLAPLFLDTGWRTLLNALLGVVVVGALFLALENLGLSVLNPTLPFLAGLLVGYLEGLRGSLLRVGAAMGMFSAFPIAAYTVYTEVVVGTDGGLTVIGLLTMPVTQGVLTALYVMALGTGAAFVAASMTGGVSAYHHGEARLDYGLDDDDDEPDAEAEDESDAEAEDEATDESDTEAEDDESDTEAEDEATDTSAVDEGDDDRDDDTTAEGDGDKMDAERNDGESSDDHEESDEESAAEEGDEELTVEESDDDSDESTSDTA